MLLAMPQKPSAPPAVRSADAFVESIGLATHWTYLDTPYGRADEAIALLKSLGVRHVRDGLGPTAERLAKLGIGTCAIAEAERESIPQFLARIRAANAKSPGSVDAIEAPNEPDLFWRGKTPYEGRGFPDGALAYSRELYRMAKADRILRGLPVIGMSFGTTFDPGGGVPHTFKPGELADTCDWGNFHPYAGGNPWTPKVAYAGIANYWWDGNAPSSKLDRFPIAFDVYRPPFGNKPIASTECGYATDRPGGISEVTHGKYIPRLFAEHFRLGIVRSYGYEFLDEFPRDDDREARFGLVRRDLSPKPAYTALKSLIALCADRGAPKGFAPKLTPLGIVVGDVPGYADKDLVHSLRLAKRNGTQIALLWHEISAEDTSVKPHRQLVHPEMPVTLTLPKGTTRATVHRYGEDWTLKPGSRTVRDGTLTLPVGETIVAVVYRVGS